MEADQKKEERVAGGFRRYLNEERTKGEVGSIRVASLLESSLHAGNLDRLEAEGSLLLRLGT